MAFVDELRQTLETEERRSVGKSFGGDGETNSFSVPSIRDWILAQSPYNAIDLVSVSLLKLEKKLTKSAFKKVVINLVRFSFLIELTDLKVGSTKMKTRWVPGQILMPAAGSFEPVRGTFEPGNDQRASSFEECIKVFVKACDLLLQNLAGDQYFARLLDDIGTWYRTPYEFVFGYRVPTANPVHTSSNITIAPTSDALWLVQARKILGSANEADVKAIAAIEKKKLEVKAYKTDRSLTGKDKTNRAKRWEVLTGDFQHATLAECWSVERQLTIDLIHFENSPGYILEEFREKGLVPDDRSKVTCCPVTLAPLNFKSFADSVGKDKHGRSDYQIGHLNPLKRGGKHIGANICWQSADGNRIQGDLTMEQTDRLLDEIAARRLARHKKPGTKV